ncbi:MAG: DUF3105 domain-containing protein [Chloroflexi bacterium]|nr:DUF3105 domain-containing protein [Chloroflexota bacterium]
MTQGMGNTHVAAGSTIDYSFCPPTSGDHYNSAGQGPIRRDFYGPESEVRPGGWVHNLEHGWVVLAYRGGEGGPTQDELTRMRAFFESAPFSTYPNSCPSVPNKVIVMRMDQMSSRFAMLAWYRALLMDEFDAEAALPFYQQWVDSPQAPEPGVC